jgi:hypothetical protein
MVNVRKNVGGPHCVEGAKDFASTCCQCLSLSVRDGERMFEGHIPLECRANFRLESQLPLQSVVSVLVPATCVQTDQANRNNTDEFLLLSCTLINKMITRPQNE